MERDSKKRSLEKMSSTVMPDQHPAKKREALETAGGCVNVSRSYITERPHGVFEFPWQKAAVAAYWEGYNVRDRDVFFSSLVDGCSAAIGHPGDRLFLAPATIVISDGEGGADGGVDGIWSCVLSQPLTALERTKA